MITCFEIHKTLRRQLSQPQRRNRRKIGKNGTVDMRKLDGVLQDLGFASKPHPTIFTENQPDPVFYGLEKFQKANGLTVDGAVNNKDSETGRALNKAMAEYYVPTKPKRAGGAQFSPKGKQRPEVILMGTDPGRPLPKPKPETGNDAAAVLIGQWWDVLKKFGDLLQKFIPPFTDQEFRIYNRLRRALEKQKKDI